MKATLRFTIKGNGIAQFHKEFNALVRDLKAVDGKKFTYQIEFESPSAATMSQFKEIPRSVIAEGLKRAHRDTKPQIYSDRIAGGGPFRQRVEVMADYLARVPVKQGAMNRKEAQARYAELDGRIFKPDTGSLGTAVAGSTKAQLLKVLDKLYG